MPRSKQSHLSCPIGGHLAGNLMGKNTHPNDFHWLVKKPRGHTRPVHFQNLEDTGIKNPSRKRLAKRKEMRKLLLKESE